ncbi:MAG: immunoglobulin domain-containing protein [Pyrinomonadaceae bacterium MAG19_C2-C3]|nr:immunoglobulin domain-containing protein [Pyrinomonadaceae bacterium MAG19_C2-C3]
MVLLSCMAGALTSWANGQTRLVSLNRAGTSGGNSDSDFSAISADGRFITFGSDASDLVENDTNNTWDIFVRDMQTGVTTLVSVNNTNTGSGNEESQDPSISADGRFIAFESYASDLVANDTDYKNVFVRDMLTGVTTLVSVNNIGAGGDHQSFNASISADGRFIAFSSFASNLVADDSNYAKDVFVRDMQTGVTKLVSVNNAGTGGNYYSFNASINADGRFVAFSSDASDLVANDTNGVADVFIRDVQTGVTTLVSIDSKRSDIGNSDSRAPSISADGRFIAFYSNASNLVANDINHATDIFVRDMQTGVTALVSVNNMNTGGNDRSHVPSISADGRFVAFSSFASNLVANDINNTKDVFVRDMQTGMITLVSINNTNTGSGNNFSNTPAISANGRIITFYSDANDLTANDTNDSRDVFVRGIANQPSCTLPRILNQPRGATVLNNQSATLKVKADNSPTFQWYKGNSGDTSQKIDGATSDSLTINSVAANSRTNYWVRVTNSCGTTNSQTMTVVAIDKLPLIFVPGAGGSYLALKGDAGNVFPNLLRDYVLFKPLSLAPEDAPFPEIVAPDVIRNDSYAGGDVYETMLNTLVRDGNYKEHKRSDAVRPTLFVFPYDWRLDIATNAGKLDAFVRSTILPFYPEADYPEIKANVLAHSMGGLLSRRYILDYPNTHKVGKLITIGSPFLGAPKAINVLETGRFLELGALLRAGQVQRIIDQRIKSLGLFFPGLHQLIPSRKYSDLSVSPFVEDGWDIDGDGKSKETYNSDNLKAMLDKRYRSLPGKNAFDFHDRSGQEDWSKDEPNVQYYHIIGIRHGADTIEQVIAKRGVVHCRVGISIPCKHDDYFDLKMGLGDGTVPHRSAYRRSGSKNLNAPTAKTILFASQSADKNENDLFSHGGMFRNYNIFREVMKAISEPNLQSNLSKSDEIRTLEDEPELPAAQPSYYFKLFGTSSVTIADAFGNNTEPFTGNSTEESPNVTLYPLAEKALLTVAPIDQTFFFTFTTGDEPLALDLTKGTSVETAQAVRYLDLNLPANTKVKLELSPSGIGALQYDGDGDGTFESTVQPTASVSGNAAQDTQAPTIGVNEVPRAATRRVTITATDEGAGVRSVFYSLDGTNFQPYNGAFEINPTQTTTVYAFAEDNVANRSSLVTYSVKKRRKGRVRRGSRDGF